MENAYKHNGIENKYDGVISCWDPSGHVSLLLQKLLTVVSPDQRKQDKLLQDQ